MYRVRVAAQKALHCRWPLFGGQKSHSISSSDQFADKKGNKRLSWVFIGCLAPIRVGTILCLGLARVCGPELQPSKDSQT